MNNQMFLVMEEDLITRFSFFTSHTGMPVHVLRLKTSLKLGKLKTILSRLSYKKKLVSEYEELKPKLCDLDKLIISNPEGFIAKNIIYWIRRDFPKLQIVSMQHGIFSLSEPSAISKLTKKLLNIFSLILLGYFIIGDGFGDKTTDKYVVYNELYKRYLLEHGWKENEIIISSFFLKGYEEVPKVAIRPNDTAVYFLQCLSALGITDEATELEMISKVTEKLAQNYKRVLIKQHPYANVILPKLPVNAEVVTSVPDIKDLSLVVSAFSTALFEYERHGIPYTSIYSKKLNVDPAVYDQFLYVHNFDIRDNELIITHNKLRESVPVFFEIGEKSLEKL